jgi:TPR repeat protein
MMKRGMKGGVFASWPSLRMAGLCVCLLQGAAFHAQAQTEPTIQDAAQAYHVGQYQRALALYEQLAQRGNAEAAERAGFMLLQANGHYGVQVRRDVDRARALITQAARADRTAAGFMLNMLENTD